MRHHILSIGINVFDFDHKDPNAKKKNEDFVTLYRHTEVCVDATHDDETMSGMIDQLRDNMQDKDMLKQMKDFYPIFRQDKEAMRSQGRIITVPVRKRTWVERIALRFVR